MHHGSDDAVLAQAEKGAAMTLLWTIGIVILLVAASAVKVPTPGRL